MQETASPPTSPKTSPTQPETRLVGGCSAKTRTAKTILQISSVPLAIAVLYAFLSATKNPFRQEPALINGSPKASIRKHISVSGLHNTERAITPEKTNSSKQATPPRAAETARHLRKRRVAVFRVSGRLRASATTRVTERFIPEVANVVASIYADAIS